MSKAKNNPSSTSNLFHDSPAQNKIWTLVAKERLKMHITISERRQIENEMIFRRLNERLIDGFDKLDAKHIAEENPKLIRDGSVPIQFTCECSDENCVELIPIQYNEYIEIHDNRKSFVVKIGHQVNPIEVVVQKETKYSVVKKHNSVKEPGSKLNPTTINNT